jgi:hypothetical protein
MDQAQILSTYAAAWAITQRMLAAARDEEWDALIEISQDRENLLAQLMQAQPAPPTDPRQAAEMASLIRSILAADQQIQTLSRAWMGEISSVLNSVQVERKLLKAYEFV